MNLHYSTEIKNANVPKKKEEKKSNLRTPKNRQKGGVFSEVTADKTQNCVSKGHAQEVTP